MKPDSDIHQPSILYYVHDPMCSWCWAFVKTWAEVRSALHGRIPIQYVVGGLAADSDQLMPVSMQNKLQQGWRRIQGVVPGTEFNFDFWQNCQPRRSTYPACRAVLVARRQGAELSMIDAIQRAYYLQSRNPSDLSILVELATEIGLDSEQFLHHIVSDEIESELRCDIALSKTLGARGFPSLILQTDQKVRLLELDYNSAANMLAQIDKI